MSMFSVFAFVIFYLIKLRFPRNKGFVEVLKHRYGPSALQQFRLFERLDFKLRKAKLDLDFLQTCKRHETIPRFLHFKVYNYNVPATTFYRSFQFRLLDFEIRQKTNLIKRTQAKLDLACIDFKNKVSHLDFIILNNRLLSSNETKINRIKIIHQRKLLNLDISPFANVDLNKVIINLSKRTLTEDETTVLSHGLNFALPLNEINFIEHYYKFEKLIQSLQNKPIPKESNLNKNDLLKLISSTAHTSFSEFNEHKHTLPKLPHNHLKALKDLKADTSITITRPDKGRGIVILDKNDYITEVEKILNDPTKFTPIKENTFTVITRIEDKIQRFLRTLLAAKIITKNSYEFLFPAGSSPGILYGLPKTHKRGKLTFRPILSALCTVNYNLAKFLVPLLEPLTKNDYTLKNSFEFVNEISEIKFDKCVMASFDIESLFTNIPINETINIICDSLFKKEKTFKKFSKLEFNKLLNFAVKDSPFIFNDKLYIQTDGVSMGSPLGPTFANCFLSHHEENWLDECPLSFKPLYYRRYIDDTFLLFKDPLHIPQFQNYLNSKHENIKFTVEHEIEGRLPFLDVQLTRLNNTISTSIYRKPTFTGLGMSFLSFIPIQFKINAIKTLLYRCFHLCSDWHSIHTEIQFLTSYFQNNKFPLHLIQRNIRSFLNKTLSPPPNRDTEKTTFHYISLPYYGLLSYDIRKKLNKALKHYYPKTIFRFIFSNPKTINSFFKHKESPPTNLISNIVYEFKCPHCNMRYVGKTERNLTLRFAEHSGKSARTGRPIARPNPSSIRTHHERMNHSYNITDFKILHKARDYLDLPMLESLYIQHTTPGLNCDSSSYLLYTFKS